MSRYFIEVAYKGTRYSGFQVQENAATIQSEIEKAFCTIQGWQPADGEKSLLTGSSRTDAGVHARQNYFHFDFEEGLHPQLGYKMNAVLPRDIVVKSIRPMPAEAHCRFDARSRSYTYYIHRAKDPFLTETSLYYPYKIDEAVLHRAAAFLAAQQDFSGFAKTNAQVKTHMCSIYESSWQVDGEQLVFRIEANRFLRGMVRLLTATQLKLARGKLSFAEFEQMFNGGRKSAYSVPAHGLFLSGVNYPDGYFEKA
ncbi:MAG: tRNA pseudouridine(38-40) synthase TruA [Flavisolibacter sp.]